MIFTWNEEALSEILAELEPTEVAALHCALNAIKGTNPGRATVQKHGFETVADFRQILQRAKQKVLLILKVKGIHHMRDFDFDAKGHSWEGCIRPR